MVNGKNMMIVYQVGYLNISHMYKKEVTRTKKWMKRLYEEYVRVSLGKKHGYLDMYLNLSIPGEVRVTIVEYVMKGIADLP